MKREIKLIGDKKIELLFLIRDVLISNQKGIAFAKAKVHAGLRKIEDKAYLSHSSEFIEELFLHNLSMLRIALKESVLNEVNEEDLEKDYFVIEKYGPATIYSSDILPAETNIYKYEFPDKVELGKLTIDTYIHYEISLKIRPSKTHAKYQTIIARRFGKVYEKIILNEEPREYYALSDKEYLDIVYGEKLAREASFLLSQNLCYKNSFFKVGKETKETFLAYEVLYYSRIYFYTEALKEISRYYSLMISMISKEIKF